MFSAALYHNTEVIKIYELFKGEVAKQKKLRKLTNKDLAKMTGLSHATIDAFMAGFRDSERTANAIAKALEIEL